MIYNFDTLLFGVWFYKLSDESNPRSIYSTKAFNASAEYTIEEGG
jgi:hypothetical protein